MDMRSMILDSPEMQDFIRTPQYRLSRELIGLRLQKGLTPEYIRDKLGLTLEEYVSLEFGNIEVCEEKYCFYLDKLKML